VKVVVVGGGVIGCSVAFALQMSGAKVTLLERGEIGGEASGASAGMLIPPLEDSASRTFNRLRTASLEMFPVWLEEVQRLSRVNVEYKRTGMLRIAQTPELAKKLKRIAKRQDGVEWVDPQVLRELEPNLGDGILGALYSEDDADLNPGLFTNALADAAAKLGAKIRPGTMLTGFLGRGNWVEGVTSNGGDVKDADMVVLAAGPWTELLTVRLNHRLGTPPMRGQMIAYRSKALRHAIWGEDGYLLPKPRGFIFAGATVEDVGFRKATTARGLNELKRMAATAVPRLKTATVASSWAGLRPGSPDGMPVIGRMPGKSNVIVATGHFRNGILLAPITGRLVADMVMTGKTDRRLKAYSPARFK